MIRVPVAPQMLRWAIARAGLEIEELVGRFEKLPAWEDGEEKPTMKQLEAFARAVHVPIGYLFLPEPPEERLTISDFRTVDGRAVNRPSPNLLETLYSCQERQAWYREFALVTRQPSCAFVGSAHLSMSPTAVAANIRDVIGFDVAARRNCRSWTDALRLFVGQADKAGVLVMISGIVLSNTNRKLDPEEFRGFALADSLAPLVFVNGADSKAGQMFTLAHELAHLWLNVSGISNASAAPLTGFRQEEVWCNAVAAELLVPLDTLRPELRAGEAIEDAMSRLARHFKVSNLVILRRLLDAGWLKRSVFDQAWKKERLHQHSLAVRPGSGGDFYRTTVARVGRRFTQAIVASTLEGQTLYRDAFRMLGVSKTQTFTKLGREVGAIL